MPATARPRWRKLCRTGNLAMTTAGADDGTGLYGYRCAACGGSATWRASKQQVVCRSCDTIVPLPAANRSGATSFFLLPYLRDSPENRRQRTPLRVELPCPTCGHLVVFESGLEGATCTACLTPLLRPPSDGDMPIRPTGVVPFRIDPADAQERLRTWWRNHRGSDRRSRHLQSAPLVARYLPYWQFSVRVHCPWRHTATDSDGKTRVTSGEVRGDYGEREPGNRSVPTELLQSLPCAFDSAVAYDRRYLAGAVVEQYDGDLFRAWDAAHRRLDDLVNKLVSKDAGVLGGPEERWPSWSQEKGWLILTPFYTTNVTVDGQRHPIVIDGHTGQIASTLPPHVPGVVWLVLVAMLAALVVLAWWLFAR